MGSCSRGCCCAKYSGFDIMGGGGSGGGLLCLGLPLECNVGACSHTSSVARVGCVEGLENGVREQRFSPP